MDIHVKMVNSKLIQCLHEYIMSSPGNRKVKGKAKSNNPATEKIELMGSHTMIKVVEHLSIFA